MPYIEDTELVVVTYQTYFIYSKIATIIQYQRVKHIKENI